MVLCNVNGGQAASNSRPQTPPDPAKPLQGKRDVSCGISALGAPPPQAPLPNSQSPLALALALACLRSSFSASPPARHLQQPSAAATLLLLFFLPALLTRRVVGGPLKMPEPQVTSCVAAGTCRVCSPLRKVGSPLRCSFCLLACSYLDTSDAPPSQAPCGMGKALIIRIMNSTSERGSSLFSPPGFPWQ